jgi:hypothetical protein
VATTKQRDVDETFLVKLGLVRKPHRNLYLFRVFRKRKTHTFSIVWPMVLLVLCSLPQRPRERERERVRKMEVDGSRRDEDMADSPTHSQQTGSHLHPSISTHTHAPLFLFGR